MAGNEWINGYLEAILDSRAGFAEESRPALTLLERGSFNPTKYFVEEVVSGFDESDLHRTWIKVVAMRNTMERNNRLENMCWRIWHLARRKKQLEWDDAHRLAKRRIEREQGRRDATEDMSEDLSEGEKADVTAIVETPKRALARNFSDFQLWSDENKTKRLYIVLISLHGLVRGENMELGRDSDTGGQVKYVVELARALSMIPGVYRVDLFTRQISSPDVDWSYGEPTEMLAPGSCDADGHGGGESSGAYIIRIPFGARDKYIRKELLWPYIQEFVDGAVAHILNMSRVLGEQIGGGDPVWPYVIHGHYADAGDSAALLSGALNVPMVLTGLFSFSSLSALQSRAFEEETKDKGPLTLHCSLYLLVLKQQRSRVRSRSDPKMARSAMLFAVLMGLIAFSTQQAPAGAPKTSPAPKAAAPVTTATPPTATATPPTATSTPPTATSTPPTATATPPAAAPVVSTPPAKAPVAAPPTVVTSPPAAAPVATPTVATPPTATPPAATPTVAATPTAAPEASSPLSSPPSPPPATASPATSPASSPTTTQPVSPALTPASSPDTTSAAATATLEKMAVFAAAGVAAVFLL